MSQGFPSANLISGQIQRALEGQMRHFEALDTKAGIILGFTGVLVVVSAGIGGLWAMSARILSATTAVVALGAFMPRRFPTANVLSLRDYLRAEEAFTRLSLIDSHIAMAIEAADVITIKARSSNSACSCSWPRSPR